MLINYMYSNWFGVEIRNGLPLGDQVLFPVAVQLDPKEGKLNDFTTGQWLSGLDFAMANEIMHMPEYGKDYYCPIRSVDIKRFTHAVDELLRTLKGAVPEE